MLKIKVSGLETIDKDYDKQLKIIDKAIPAGLSVVGNEMAAALQRHVQKDVYAAYSPEVYKRTGEMGDINNMITTIDKASNTLTFDYRFGTGSARPYFKESDQVIAAIQDSDYLWNVSNRDIPKRPFWDNFFNELFNNNKVDEYFAKGVNQAKPELQAAKGNDDIIFTNDDRQLYYDPFNMSGGIVYAPTQDDD